MKVSSYFYKQSYILLRIISKITIRMTERIHSFIIEAIVGTGNEWRKHEISFLSSSHSEINFQTENQNQT